MVIIITTRIDDASRTQAASVLVTQNRAALAPGHTGPDGGLAGTGPGGRRAQAFQGIYYDVFCLPVPAARPSRPGQGAVPY